jgi:2'-5' RNA ligase
MPGVIAVLDDVHSARVEALWDEMERRFAVPKGYPGALPHITFHLGSHDVDAGAEAVVERVAARTRPLTITTAGLGVFGGSSPVVYLAVARSPEVAALAGDLGAEMEAGGFPSTDPYFAPDKWIPHITIAHRNLAGIALGPVLAWLVEQPLAWEVPLRSLSIARETESSVEILATFPLSG